MGIKAVSVVHIYLHTKIFIFSTCEFFIKDRKHWMFCDLSSESLPTGISGKH